MGCWIGRGAKTINKLSGVIVCVWVGGEVKKDSKYALFDPSARAYSALFDHSAHP